MALGLIYIMLMKKEREQRFWQRHPLHCNPDTSVYPMNPFRRMVPVGHNASMFVENMRPTERKDIAKLGLKAICNATRGIDSGHGVIRHRGVSDSSDRAHPL